MMTKKCSLKAIIIFLISVSFCFSAAVYGKETEIILKGAGATFPYPLYKEWMRVYKAETGIRMSYRAIGSGGGIKALLNREVDFGATDAFLSDRELKKTENEILHIPTCMGAVVIIYNLPGKPALQLSPRLVTDIFLGKITRWSDKQIQTVNPGVKFPDLKIALVHRSDSSGTTFIFTNYLSAISRQWKENVGAGKLVRWPTGIGVERNPGVANFVKKVPGAIGYVELTYAVHVGLPTAMIQNKSGHFIKPTLKSLNYAARVRLPEDTRTLIIDTPTTRGYPISAFTWLIFYKEQSYGNRSLKRAKTLACYLWWVIHNGQNYNTQNIYGTLPSEAIKKAENIIRSMVFRGKPIAVRHDGCTDARIW